MENYNASKNIQSETDKSFLEDLANNSDEIISNSTSNNSRLFINEDPRLADGLIDISSIEPRPMKYNKKHLVSTPAHKNKISKLPVFSNERELKKGKKASIRNTRRESHKSVTFKSPINIGVECPNNTPPVIHKLVSPNCLSTKLLETDIQVFNNFSPPQSFLSPEGDNCISKFTNILNDQNVLSISKNNNQVELEKKSVTINKINSHINMSSSIKQTKSLRRNLGSSAAISNTTKEINFVTPIPVDPEEIEVAMINGPITYPKDISDKDSETRHIKSPLMQPSKISKKSLKSKKNTDNMKTVAKKRKILEEEYYFNLKTEHWKMKKPEINVDGFRRSQRTRSCSLEYWRNETLAYKSTKQGYEIIGINSPPSKEEFSKSTRNLPVKKNRAISLIYHRRIF